MQTCEKEQRVLFQLRKVAFIAIIEILEFTIYYKWCISGFLAPNQFAYKPQLIRFVFEHSDVQMYFGLIVQLYIW